VWFRKFSSFLLWRKLSQYLLDRFSRFFHKMESICVHFLDPVQFFRFLKGRFHGNQLILGKCHERRLIPLIFVALSLENEMQYHCFDVCINSVGDVATSYKNVVNFCLVTREIMEIICIPRYLYFAKVDLHIWIHRAAVQKCRGVLERWWTH